jgi:hypothetical protein
MWDQIVATAEPHSKLDMVGFLYLNPTYKIGDRTQATIERVRKRFVESGIESSLTRKKQEHRRAKIIDGEKEAYLIAIACSETPTGPAILILMLEADFSTPTKNVITLIMTE